MRKSNLKIIVAVACTLITISSFSQGTTWRLAGNNNVTGGTSYLGTANAQPIDFRTNNIIRMRLTPTGFIGIGNNFNAPSAVLHINAVNNGTGETFRTTSNATGANNFNAWRMFVGTGNGTEKFAILNPVGSDNIHIRASRSDANIQFQITSTVGGTLSPITRMVITDGPFFAGTQTGLVGIGNGFVTPKSQLHLNDGNFATHLQITNIATNPTTTPAGRDLCECFIVG